MVDFYHLPAFAEVRNADGISPLLMLFRSREKWRGRGGEEASLMRALRSGR